MNKNKKFMKFEKKINCNEGGLGVSVMVLNVTFNNISDISWRPILLVQENGITRDNHPPAASHIQTLLHNFVSSASSLELTTLVMIGTDCIDSYKSNYHDGPSSLCKRSKLFSCTIYTVKKRLNISRQFFMKLFLFIKKLEICCCYVMLL